MAAMTENVTVKLSSGKEMAFGPLTCWDSILVEKELGQPPYTVQSMSLAYCWRSHVASGKAEGGLSFKSFLQGVSRQDQDAIIGAVAPFISAVSSA
jgi:hypothetical protein